MTRKTQAEYEAAARWQAARDNNPDLLIGPDIIHYAECLIRFYDHPVLTPGYEFWGEVADHLNRAMHLPEHSDYSSPRRVREFNAAVTMAYRYLDISPASYETRTTLLHRYFLPPGWAPWTEEDTERLAYLEELGGDAWYGNEEKLGAELARLRMRMPGSREQETGHED